MGICYLCGKEIDIPHARAPEYSLDQALRVQQKKMTFSAYSMR